MPSAAAHPSSRWIVAGSNVAAWNISSWFEAVDGRKLQPTSQGCCRYHRWAWLGSHVDELAPQADGAWAMTAAAAAAAITPRRVTSIMYFPPMAFFKAFSAHSRPVPLRKQ